MGSPRKGELGIARDWGERGTSGGGEGKVPWPLHSSLLSEGPLPCRRQGRRASRSCLWSGSAEETPLALKYAGVRVCTRTGRVGEASVPE